HFTVDKHTRVMKFFKMGLGIFPAETHLSYSYQKSAIKKRQDNHRLANDFCNDNYCAMTFALTNKTAGETGCSLSVFVSGRMSLLESVARLTGFTVGYHQRFSYQTRIRMILRFYQQPLARRILQTWDLYLYYS